MISLIQRTEKQGLLHHQSNPVRVYIEDNVQRDRVERSCHMAGRATPPGLSEGQSLKVIELGCGAGDICGPLSEMFPEWALIGVDCNEACLKEAEKRYPRLLVRLSSIQPVLVGEYDLVILCETLEHLADPNAVAAGALAKARFSVISHPLDEPLGSGLSGGDHAWSLSMEDHLNFFALGGHVVDETETFSMGCYKIVLSRGHRCSVEEYEQVRDSGVLPT